MAIYSRKGVQDAEAKPLIQTLAYKRASLEVPIDSAAIKSENYLRDSSWHEK